MEVKETVIRLMTRLAIEHQAVNLSQGFTDEAPVFDMVWGSVAAAVGGTQEGVDRLNGMSVQTALDGMAKNAADVSLRDLLASLQNPRDQYSQYSFPFGLPELRAAIAEYTEKYLALTPDPNNEITVVLGASEGMAAAFRGLFSPGDAVLIIEPFHEIYPAQLRIFELEPRFVTLRENSTDGPWTLDLDELKTASADPRVKGLILNTPHNPTGKVFGEEELEAIAQICLSNDLLVISDEIYEHMVYDGHHHRSIATIDGMRERTMVVNSISKTGRATGWRVGWVITPAKYTPRLRAIHDNLAVQAPTPLQKGAVQLLTQPSGFFGAIAGHYRNKREQLMTGLRGVGFRVSAPEGAYYLFADYRGVGELAAMAPTDAAMHLIKERGVATVPGDNFYALGDEGKNYLRFAFCRGRETLDEGIARLSTLS